MGVPSPGEIKYDFHLYTFHLFILAFHPMTTLNKHSKWFVDFEQLIRVGRIQVHFQLISIVQSISLNSKNIHFISNSFRE